MKFAGGFLAAVLVCALHASVFAQGYNQPPPPGGPTGPEPPGVMTQFRWDAGLLIALPMQDLDDGADTSIGFRGALGYNVNPNVSIHAALRYIFVNSEIDGLDLSYYDFGIGGRYAINSSGNIQPYVEGEFLYTTISASADGFDDSQSDPGVLVRGGGIYKWRPNMDIIFFGSYTMIFPDEGDEAWLELGGGLQGYF